MDKEVKYIRKVGDRAFLFETYEQPLRTQIKELKQQLKEKDKEIKDLGFGIIQVNELKPTISKTESVDNYLCKWQKLKEWLEYRTAENGVFDNYDSLAVEDNLILDKMQELEGEDE